ncbi:inner membrane protein YaaH [bacterium BMS3Abin04]|nr:inner membrane protein YaaH [bacterium BMS3Abin04]
MAEETRIVDTTANPAPLGLMAFGMTTVLLNLHNAGIFHLGTMILAMGVFYGGLAQVFAGWMEWKKGNTFGTTAFTSYGLFWITLVFLILGGHWKWFDAPAEGAMVAYLFMWGLFTFGMWVATLKHNKALQVVFFTLFILFWLLAIKDATGSATVGIIAGWEGLFCGLSAVYLSLALVINETYGKTVLPIGEK